MEHHPGSQPLTAKADERHDAETIMRFGNLEISSTQIATMNRHDLVELFLRNGLTRVTAERILEVHRDRGVVGRARSPPMSRSSR